MSVTVILNGYKRPHALKEQYNAVIEQTYPEIKVMFWGNYDTNSADQFPREILTKCTTAFCNQNLGVWARFAFALNADTDYICMLDDDTIPGKRWIQHCYNTMQESEGLIGGRGVKFIDENYKNYPSCKYEGVGRGNAKTKRVDIIGHSWFFKKDWLRYYWAEMPMVRFSRGGEDMHFSFVLQKHLGLNSYIPSQPEENPELWASTDPSKYGEDMSATSRTVDGHMEAHCYWNFMINNGYKLTKDSE
jgi:cellulose synthase/poly-beta-1,6-N-acetylglucosamine synthase-like glycosyltransferase